MSVPPIVMTVMSMLSVSTLLEASSVTAEMVLMEMAEPVKV